MTSQGKKVISNKQQQEELLLQIKFSLEVELHVQEGFLSNPFLVGLWLDNLIE